MSARAEPAPARRGLRRRGDAADDFRLMADSAPVMIWVSGPDRRCVYVNRPWREFTGRTLDDSVGHGWSDGIHPGDRDRVLATYARSFERQEPFELEYRLRRQDGAWRWLLDKGVPLVIDDALSGFIGSCLDITDRMAAEQEARKREEDFKTLAGNIPDVILRLDRTRRCVYANPAVEHAFGVRVPALVGRERGELALPAAMREALGAAVDRAFEGGEEQPFGFQSGDGDARRHYVGRVIPERDPAGRVEAVLAITYDVTARALEDEKRARLLEHERSARANAESAALARDQFLAIVSHELRSPLNGIKSWTHVLQNQLRNSEPTVRRALAGIMIGVDHQVRLIEDLLDVTRALSGNLRLLKQRMRLLPVLAEAVESQRATALEKGLHFGTDFTLGEREIEGDPDRVRQVFVNLLVNAIKFTPRGGTIRVAARAEGGSACVEVRDTGAGIAPDFLPHVFDPFRQADEGSSRRSQEGLGLGLALVQRLATLHGGRATCESPGLARGSTFRVYFPLLAESGVSAPQERKASQARATALPSLAGLRLLLIDDQREARESLAMLLGQAGAKVVAAASGQEALAHLALADDGEQPHVVVCDIAMPGEDGYATLKRIRAWDASHGRSARSRPAIALSAFAQREDRMRALAEGFQVHLTKPVVPADLMAALANVARAHEV